MDEYIGREAVLKIIADNCPHDKGGYNTEEEMELGRLATNIRRAVETVPTAEVVPKSEVERLQSEVERLKKDNEYILMQHRFQRRPSGDCWNDVIEKAKADVAWAIFDNVDEIAYRYLNDSDYSAGDMIYDLNELKKKYTEEKT